MYKDTKTAGVIIIGNEILSGRTQDSNLAYIAARLNKLGICLLEARVIPDIEDTIIDTVRTFSNAYDYVFTTGGIGPTHDDITTECVAKAFANKLIRHPDAVDAMERYYEAGELTEARLKMADVPEQASLILNPVSAAPGYQLNNVFVLAGVPNIMQAMFDSLQDRLAGGAPILSASVSTNLGESKMSVGLAEIQQQSDTVSIGSYPYFKKGRLGVNIVLRSTDNTELKNVFNQVKHLIGEIGGRVLDFDEPG